MENIGEGIDKAIDYFRARLECVKGKTKCEECRNLVKGVCALSEQTNETAAMTMALAALLVARKMKTPNGGEKH